MAAKLAIFIIRSLISLLLGGAHVYFVILCFGFISSINPIPAWLAAEHAWQGSLLLWLSIMDLMLHIILALPAAVALLYLQGQLRRYHLALVTLPILGLGLVNLWQLFALRHEVSLTYLSYLNAIVPAITLAIVGLVTIKHFGHIKPRTTPIEL